MLARLPMTLDACLVLISNSPAIALTRAPFFIAFVVLGGNILLSAGGYRGETERAARLLDWIR